jgi:hypothetical protein
MPTCLTVSRSVAPVDSGSYRLGHGEPMTVFFSRKTLKRRENIDLEPPISGPVRCEEILPCLPMPL